MLKELLRISKRYLTDNRGFFGLIGGKKKQENSAPQINWEKPEWTPDEYYKPTQDFMFDFGKNMLAGDVPDYFKPIGEIGGSEYDKFMAMVTRDTVNQVEGSAAARGVGRAGATTSAVAKSVGDISAQYGWADFLRAIQGRSDLLKLGTGIVSDVRSAGLTNQGQRNQFELGASDLDLKKQMAQTGIDIDYEKASGALGGDFMSSILGSEGPLLDSIMGDSGTGFMKSQMDPMDMDVGSMLDSVFGGMGSAEGGKKTEFYKDPNFYMQLAATLGPILLGCWVAAAVFNGWDDERTKNARFFINFISPRWFRDFYWNHGERFAEYIKDKPIIKAILFPIFSVFAVLGKRKKGVMCYGLA
jgi:hypothetical protein